MTRRWISLLLAAGAAAVLLPATAAEARCYGDEGDPRTTVCNTVCRVYAELKLAYC